MQPAELGLYFSILLFIIGFLGVVCRKNIIFIMLSIEIILNSANLAFICASKITGTFDGQVLMFFVIAVAASEAAVGLALMYTLYRRRSTVDIDDLQELRG